MQVVVGSDHAAVELRQALVAHLRAGGHDVLEEVGPAAGDRADYPQVAQQVARRVVDTSGALGVLVCGTGQGMAMAANKIAGVRAGVCGDTFSAAMTRAHNDANVLCMGSRVLGEGLALAILDAFLGAQFEGGRHATRVDMIRALDR